MANFKDVSEPKFAELEQQRLESWAKNDIFAKTLENRKDSPRFTFYEGPPTANGMPHFGHLLTRSIKDLFPRYKTMTGHYAPRRAGWDTHGLPVEVEVQKTLGLHGKDPVAEYGLEQFTRACADSVFTYSDAWEKLSERIGFWVDFKDAYVTYHTEYIESVWWALKTMFERGLLYKDYKVMWWWPQGGTALSSAEVSQGYKSVDDPAVYVKFEIKEQPGTYFVAWTTTPWTLPSNVALAVAADEDYVTVDLGEEKIVVGAGALERVAQKAGLTEQTDDEPGYKVIETKKGSDWLGAKYNPPFTYSTPDEGKFAEVVVADFVEMGSGSGFVHIAPAFGEDDFKLRKDQGLGFLQLLKPDGTFPEEVTDFAGRFCKEADPDIVKLLDNKGLLLAHETYNHEYPFCWRADDDPLIQYAREGWFIRTTEVIDKVIENNQMIQWQPDHVKDGRFGKFLEGNVDWALSRERYWGTPLPIWINDVTGNRMVVDSVEEIERYNPNAFDAFNQAKVENPELNEHLAVHKPWIDDVTWQIDGEEGTYRRIPEVIDCWFDSGSMPFAQVGYPHRNKEEFEATFPAQFISEGVDQTRGWFYSLIMINTILFGPDVITANGKEILPRPYENCVVLGLLTDKKGKKLSKRDKNYADPYFLIDEFGADSIRWAMLSNTAPGQGTKFDEDSPKQALSEVILKIWNVYKFFVTYANIDGWDPSADQPTLNERSELDRWIYSELNETVAQVREAMDSYRWHLATRRITSYLDALSNWYVRRSRDRFWASEDSVDKQSAYATLYENLMASIQLVAPFMPFFTDEIYENLVHGVTDAPESIHLTDYPDVLAEREDNDLRVGTRFVRQTVKLGQKLREVEKLKVRQPLRKATIVSLSSGNKVHFDRFKQVISEELNVIDSDFTDEAAEYVSFEVLPNFGVLGPKLREDLPKAKQALANLDGSAAYAQLEQESKLTLTLDGGKEIELTNDEVQVRIQPIEGLVAESSGDVVVILDTDLDQELLDMGLARELVNRIQGTRRDLDLDYTARITVNYSTEHPRMAQVIENHGDYIRTETLTTELSPSTAGSVTTEIDGHDFSYTIEVNS